jgi:hypothetical protein
MNKIIKITVAMLVLLALTQCTPKFSTWTSPNYEAKTFEKIVVYGISNNITNRLRYESTMVAVLKEAGIDAVSAYDYKKDNNKSTEAETAAILQQLLDDGVDGIITTALVDKNVETVYNPGATYSVPSYGRTFRGYSYRTYGYVQEPGYYSQETTYLLENNFYQISENGDEDNDGLIWSAQSEESKPSNQDKMNQKYAERILHQLKADGILK